MGDHPSAEEQRDFEENQWDSSNSRKIHSPPACPLRGGGQRRVVREAGMANKVQHMASIPLLHLLRFPVVELGWGPGAELNIACLEVCVLIHMNLNGR